MCNVSRLIHFHLYMISTLLHAIPYEVNKIPGQLTDEIASTHILDKPVVFILEL